MQATFYQERIQDFGKGAGPKIIMREGEVRVVDYQYRKNIMDIQLHSSIQVALFHRHTQGPYCTKKNRENGQKWHGNHKNLEILQNTGNFVWTS